MKLIFLIKFFLFYFSFHYQKYNTTEGFIITSCPGGEIFFIKQIHYLLNILDIEISDVLFWVFNFWTLFIPFQISDTLLKRG